MSLFCWFYCNGYTSVCFYLSEPKVDPDRVTPTPIDPEEIEVNVAFQPDPTDLVLSSVPGGELFNPRKHRFSEDELKPQPMIKKAKKVFVPEDAKVRLNQLNVFMNRKIRKPWYGSKHVALMTRLNPQASR